MSSVSESVSVSVSVSVPANILSRTEFYRHINYTYWLIDTYAIKGSWDVYTNEETFTENYPIKGHNGEPLSIFFRFVENTLSQSWCSPYVSIELMEALKGLRCAYDQALLEHKEHSSEHMHTEWLCEYLGTTESFRKCFELMNAPVPEIDGMALYYLCKELNNHLRMNHAEALKIKKEMDRPALLKTICKKHGVEYNDDLYANYIEWHAHNDTGNRYENMSNFIKNL